MRPIILIRHGQSTFNAHYEATGNDPGHIDARLTEKGETQAKAAGDALAHDEIDHVILSPLTRAIQTGLHIFGHRPVTFEVTCKHRERLESSCDVGRSPHDLKADFPHLDFAHLNDPWWHHEPNTQGAFATEPHHLFQDRVTRFQNWIAAHPAKRVAVIGHGTFFYHLTGHWMQNCEILHWSPSN
jgi:glucosyl-3-phosphoglycerate phosphatase